MIVASRKLFAIENGLNTDVDINVYLPEYTDGSWVCRFEINWPAGRFSRDARGLDAMQAIQLAMQSVGSELYGSMYHQEGRLFWERPGTGYGFPVSRAMRDLLVGADAEYYEPSPQVARPA